MKKSFVFFLSLFIFIIGCSSGNNGPVPSTDATLSSLELSEGTLTPEFSSEVENYTVTIENSIDEISITPTASDSAAPITVAGEDIISGMIYGPVSLATGVTSIEIEVTAEDASVKTYTVSVIRNYSGNNYLASLSLPGTTLSPGFTPDNETYTATVRYTVEEVTVTAQASDLNAAITIGEEDLGNAGTSQALALSTGENEINVVVEAEDGSEKTYTITITREEQYDNALLESLELSEGTLSPQFSPETFLYDATVEYDISAVTITAALSDSYASMAMDGIELLSGTASESIELTVGQNEKIITVTAENGSTRQYTINIERLTPPVTFDGDYTIESQADVDAFAAAGYTHITGSLIIQDSTDIVNLTGMETLRDVGLKLRIESNAVLESLTGLENITSISSVTSVGAILSISSNDELLNLDGLSGLVSNGLYGGLYLSDNDKLQNIDGLSGLTAFGLNGIEISGNSILENIDGLSNVATVNGEITISYNDSLQNINGLSSVTKLMGLSIRQNGVLQNIEGLQGITISYTDIRILNNTALTTIDGLRNLTTVEGDLSISGTSITHVNGLSKIISIGHPHGDGSFSLDNNDLLTDISGLSNLVSIKEGLNISENEQLGNLDGLSSLTTIEYLTLENNPSLTDINGLNSISSGLGMVYITGNTSLEEINIFSSVPSFSAEIIISSNAALQSINGFSGTISASTNWLTIEDNNELKSINGFQNVTESTGNINIRNNDKLESINGFTNLETVSGDGVGIYYNELLYEIQGFTKLTTMNASLGLSYNPELVDISGFSGLEYSTSLGIYDSGLTSLNSLSSFKGTTNGGLSICHNAHLTSLSGLSSLQAISSEGEYSANLFISDNALLDDLAMPQLVSIYGDIYIYNNPDINNSEIDAFLVQLTDFDGTVTTTE